MNNKDFIASVKVISVLSKCECGDVDHVLMRIRFGELQLIIMFPDQSVHRLVSALMHGEDEIWAKAEVRQLIFPKEKVVDGDFAIIDAEAVDAQISSK